MSVWSITAMSSACSPFTSRLVRLPMRTQPSNSCGPRDPFPRARARFDRLVSRDTAIPKEATRTAELRRRQQLLRVLSGTGVPCVGAQHSAQLVEDARILEPFDGGAGQIARRLLFDAEVALRERSDLRQVRDAQ